MRAFVTTLALCGAAMMAGCGGGGGSPGNTQLEYKITLRSDSASLPVNIGGAGPGIGTYAPYTTTLYVNATEGGNPIVGTKGAFACNLDAGQNVGSLYYLDGDPDHETELQQTDENGNKIRVPNAYRNIVLDSNSGGNTFHFHAGATRGTARITCSITNPRDNQVSAVSTEIVVGNSSAPAVGMPASVALQARSGYLGAQANPNNVPGSISVQAMLRDEVGQWVSDTTSPNLQVYIQGDGAAAGARLLHDRQSGTVIMTNTRSGVADFSLTSGVDSGVITLVLVADRADNNVANGIQDPVIQRIAIPVVNGIALTALAASDLSITATCRQAVASALVATGGVPPYTWTALGTMPAGLTLAPNGLVTGVPTLVNGSGAGDYQVAVRVTDANRVSVVSNLSVSVQAGECKPLVIADANLAATTGRGFTFAFSATGGKSPYKWVALGALPTGLTLTDSGVLSGALGAKGVYPIAVQVTDSDGTVVSANFSITVTDPS